MTRECRMQVGHRQRFAQEFQESVGAQVGFGTDAKYYTNTSSSNFNSSLYQNDLAQAQLAAGSGDTYNFDVNVDSVSDLDDLLKIKEQAQQRSRMK